MAQYVGKVFKIKNSSLGIKGSGTHDVHVTWFNPKTKKFSCKILTSLERVEPKEKLSKRKNTIVRKVEGDKFFVFERQKYVKLREGKIVPIPVGKVKGTTDWMGYEESKDLHISTLKKGFASEKQIKK